MTKVANKQTGKKRRAGPGRPKGSVNKTTASVKAALTEAFEKRGGVPALIAWSKEDPKEFYKLWGKMLPQEVSGPDGEPIKFSGTLRWGNVEIPL